MEKFASIQEKYTTEAQKRLRPDGTDQYQVLSQSDSDHLRHLVDDIWADHAVLDALPPPLASGACPKFLIIGAGMGGIMSAVRLIQAGFTADQIRIVDTAGGIGGTWYWNRYPGLHCDVEAYVYLPLLEEMGYMPSHKYAPGVEIRNYLKSVVKRWDLEDKILFRTKTDKIEWDEPARVWKIDLTTSRGPGGAEKVSLVVNAEFVWLTAGLLSRPKIPKLPGTGIEGFKGDLFHTSLWNYDVTGGSSEEVFPVLSKLKNKRVGIIGTGATAIQVVPYLAKYAKEVYVFQRTPSAVYARGQRRTDPEEWKKITSQPGWQLDRNKNMASHISNSAPPGTPDLVNDEWTKQLAYSALVGDEKFALVAPDKIPDVISYFMEQDAENSARLRARVAEIVKDKETAQKLTPWYPAWCKRNTFSDTYLQSFNEPHVHLIDTDGKGVDGVTPYGIVANDQEIPLDVLVLGTGYQSPGVLSADAAAHAGVTLLGREGKTIPERWATTGPATLHGYASHGFPNLFWLSPLQAGVGANHVFTLDTQCQQIAYVAAEAHKRMGGFTQSGFTVEAEEAAQEAWSQRIVQGAGRFATMAICTPSYMNNEGHVNDPNATPEEMLKRARASPYSGGILGFLKELEEWREGDKLSGIKVSSFEEDSLQN
ncbi:FAD/NAD(P)-binding domain-containing protein [Annulohypoxylon truncatum]|uniref:FAD/NAD(P)-binding domain-containing protein n=1 Tax=Annulohypoxylon truncatum TaxID=327061 RepID=UPI00200837D4|nr:FAD/NAD(P)-binding domain-containing protein [Annulohypoxylon truncatum]KAI1205344.1 FAD/NAD(P)-binding domain-containing protein [Annulohypoxylon truncatum]